MQESWSGRSRKKKTLHRREVTRKKNFLIFVRFSISKDHSIPTYRQYIPTCTRTVARARASRPCINDSDRSRTINDLLNSNVSNPFRNRLGFLSSSSAAHPSLSVSVSLSVGAGREAKLMVNFQCNKCVKSGSQTTPAQHLNFSWKIVSTSEAPKTSKW